MKSTLMLYVQLPENDDNGAARALIESFLMSNNLHFIEEGPLQGVDLDEVQLTISESNTYRAGGMRRF